MIQAATQEHPTPEELARRATRGDRAAQEALVRAIQPPVRRLALRMLAEPSEAEDATQEILIKVLRGLRSFRGDSRLTTWVHTVAANHLRTLRTRGNGRRWTSLEQLQERHPGALEGQAVPPRSERAVLMRELRQRYLQGLLGGLDRDHRMAYVLGELLELDGTEAARVLGVRPATFRKRLSRARIRIRTYMLDCQACEAPAPAVHPEAMDELARIHRLLRSLPARRAPGQLVAALTEMMSEGGAQSLAVAGGVR